MKPNLAGQRPNLTLAGASLLLLLASNPAQGQSAWLPPAGQVVVGTQYVFETYRELYGDRRQPVRLRDDVNQHTFSLTGEYGLGARWAVDATLGYVTTDTTAFGPGFSSDSGLTDSRLGLRYGLANEFDSASAWMPTVTARVGGIAAGTYSYLSPAGDGASGGESSLLVGKVLPGLGVGLHAEVGYRVRENPVPDEYFAVVGVFKRVDEVVLSAGVRHTQAVSGQNLGGGRPRWPQLKEFVDQFELGFGWVEGPRTYQIFSAYTFDGKNSPKRLALGLGMSWGF
jgi:hypothetical protein